MGYVVSACSQTIVPVTDGGQFPVRRIYCVGRNYAAHAREMGHDPTREEPFFFLKPADAIVLTDQIVSYPRMSREFHHEVELVLAIGRDGAEISSERAHDHIFGAAVGVDLTRRDLQMEAKKQGRPWDMGKAFDHSAPCGAITPLDGQRIASDSAIWLTVNNAIRQQSTLAELIWSPAEIVFWLSKYVDIRAGDLIYTGTPEGVGPLSPGDVLQAHIDGLSDLRISIGAPRAAVQANAND
jgi:fumarylpyruvate hydrolase